MIKNQTLKIFSLLIAGILFIASSASAEVTKVGFVYTGPIGDQGWSYRHHEGLLAVEKAFGKDVKTAYIEKVPEGADAVRVIRQLAANGNSLIFTTSFGFMNPTVQVAKSFPKVKFEHATGYKTAKNVSAYNARFYETRYLTGIIGGSMTKTNKLGYIASLPIPEVVRGINSAILGARSVNPKAEIRVIWISTWYDPGKEADAAKALIDQGVDMIYQHTDSPAPCQAAEEKGAYCFGQASDNSKFAPKANLTSVVNNWNNYYVERVKAVKDGSWKSQKVWYGLKEGIIELSDFSKTVPTKVRNQVKQAEKDIISGKRHPFAGEIKDQNGKVLYKKGQVIPDEDLLGMNYYVQGVVGKLPK